MAPSSARSSARLSGRRAAYTLTLSSPSSAINVFDEAAAERLTAGLRAAREAGAGAVVLRSDKPASFMNGASLLVASTATTPEQVRRASAPLRAAYEALAACALPTIAVVEGACYGCGLELALCCDFRVAKDVHAAQFYMTELPDYRLVTIFGGTQRLPRLIGKRAAARLLIDGELWGPTEAEAAGLIDAVLPAADFERQLGAVLERLLARPPAARARPAKRRREPDLPPTPESVPPPLRALDAEYRRLINLSTRVPLAQGLAEELEASIRTVAAPEARRAAGYFFVRQMALAASWGTAQPLPPELRLAAPEVPVLHQLLVHRQRGREGPWLELGPPAGGAHRARASDSFLPLALADAAETLVYVPGEAAALGFCEVALSQQDAGAPLARALRACGLEPLATRPATELVTNRLLAAWARQLLSQLDAGVTAAELHAAFFAAGYGRSPAQVLRPFARAPALLAAVSSGRLREPEAARLVHAFAGARATTGAGLLERALPVQAALLAEVSACLDDGSLTHASQGDVLAERLFGFPREQGSLLLAADDLGLEALLDRAADQGFSLATAPAAFTERLQAGRGFYTARPRRAPPAPVIVVTGALGDLGRRVVERLADGGATVVATDLPPEADVGTAYLPLDVTQEASVRHARDVVLDRFGRVDGLVTCAGRFLERALLSTSDAHLSSLLDVNLAGAYRCLRAFAQVMTRQRSGRVVLVASLAGRHGLPGATAYAAAKAGVMGLSRAAAVELAPFGVGVTCVVPGFIDSALTRAYMSGRGQGFASRIPLGRFLDAGEVADLIAFLVTTGGSFMTGSELVVDGGYDAA